MSNRRKNHWGWGWADKFGDRSQREALGQMAKAMLGLEPKPVRDPVGFDEVELPDSNIAPPESMASWVDDDKSARIHHTYARSFPEIWRGFRGDFDAAPDLVATPPDEEALEALLEWAAQEMIAVVPYGGGTSVVRGVTPDRLDDRFAGWLSVDLGEFDDFGPVDELDRTARMGAGLLGPAIEQRLEPRGLTLRHYPQSFEFSTLGGWLATRAGGHFATNYTRIDDLVESLRMVTPAGVFNTPEVPSTGAGPDPKALILGSEGALGFITSAVMNVRPRPIYRSKAEVYFDELDEAVDACRRVVQAHLFPTNCRLLDKREAMFNGVVDEPKHVLLLGFESADAAVDDLMERALKLACSSAGECPDGPRHTRRDTSDDSSSGRWKQAFFEAPYLQSRLMSVGIIADTFETSIRWSAFSAFHRALKSRLQEAMEPAGGGRLTLRFTHAYPDGPAPYYTFVVAAEEDEMLETWRRIRHAAADVIADHGATITHHHAVGRLHRPWYQQERSEPALAALRALKKQLDPAGILNPGALL